METTIRKATRLEYQAPKSKHILALVDLTFQEPAKISQLIHELEKRHREASWIISFKVLVIVHSLIRLGSGDQVLVYLAKNPSVLDTNRLERSKERSVLGNIIMYKAYLEHRVSNCRTLGNDYVKSTMANKVSRLRHLSVAKGLLRETKELQKHIKACLQCQFSFESNASASAITFHAFRLVLEDLLVVFQAVNEGTVNILEHYFEMSKYDAKDALEIYKHFAEQTKKTMAYLDFARSMQADLGMQIPVIKHAPLSLIAALEEYLNDSQSSETQMPKTTVPSVSTSTQILPQTLVQSPVQTQTQPTSFVPMHTPFQQKAAPVFAQSTAVVTQPPTIDLLGSIEDDGAMVLRNMTGQSYVPNPAPFATSRPISSNPFRTISPQTTGHYDTSPYLPMNTSYPIRQSSTNPFRTDSTLPLSSPQTFAVQNSWPTGPTNPFAR